MIFMTNVNTIIFSRIFFISTSECISNHNSVDFNCKTFVFQCWAQQKKRLHVLLVYVIWIEKVFFSFYGKHVSTSRVYKRKIKSSQCKTRELLIQTTEEILSFTFFFCNWIHLKSLMGSGSSKKPSKSTSREAINPRDIDEKSRLNIKRDFRESKRTSLE
jgi:hypothetical protein